MRVRDWLKIGAWNALFILIVVISVDIGLRWTEFDEARHRAINYPQGYFAADPELGVTLARNAPRQTFEFRGPTHDIFTNALGCFDAPVRLKPGERYILAIGDSFTWGYAPLEAKWTSHIERKTGIRVLKCGMSGTGTQHQLIRLRRLLARLPHPPSLVIHLYDTTDFNDDYTFPAYAVIAEQQVENFESISLMDGHRTPLTKSRREKLKELILSDQKGFLERNSTLYNLAVIGLQVDARVERRRLVIEGQKETRLRDKYEFNLLLLDDREYPHVAGRLDAHMRKIRELHQFVRAQGIASVMFHTNSFRLPDERPLVKRLKGFLDDFPPFQGWMPELEKHRFDPHWTARSNGKVADVMLTRMTEKSILPLNGKKISRR